MERCEDLPAARPFRAEGLGEAALGGYGHSAGGKLDEAWSVRARVWSDIAASARDVESGDGGGESAVRSRDEDGRAGGVRYDRASLRARVSPVEFSYARLEPESGRVRRI